MKAVLSRCTWTPGEFASTGPGPEELVGVDPPKVAALRNGRLEIFSLERLMHLATRLGHDVQITLRPHPRTNVRRARNGAIQVIDHSDPDEISII